METKNICTTCKYAIHDYQCNRYVAGGLYGVNDILGSNYKHGNTCPYYVAGTPRTDIHPIQMGWNS